MKHYFYQLWLVANQFINAVLGGYADETISARCYREGRKTACKILDAIYFWQKAHCRSAFQNELARKHLPSVYNVQPVA